jgi:hypothetical protein
MSIMRFQFDSIVQLASAPWRWLVRRRRLALFLIPFGLVSNRAYASDENAFWAPVASKPADRTRYDLELTLRARRLLVEDPALARYELTVRVDDRVAELTGPVPSMEIAQRAESHLKGLLGLAGIRNRLTIASSSTQAHLSTDRARTDWRSFEIDSPQVSTTSASATFASRLAGLPAEPTFSWRPAASRGSGAPFPIPFIPEGLSRPPEVREHQNDSTAGGRENLRIGKVDYLSDPAATRAEPDVFVLPAIDLRHVDAKPAASTWESLPTPRPAYFFFGF